MTARIFIHKVTVKNYLLKMLILQIFPYIILPLLRIANPEKNIQEFNEIDHSFMKAHCNFFKLLRRRKDRGAENSGLYPFEGVDLNEDSLSFCILCDHSRCDYNSYMEYAFASIVHDGKITREELNLLRHIGFEEEANSESPTYDRHKNCPLNSNHKAGVSGKFKFELFYIKEFIKLRSKTAAYLSLCSKCLNETDSRNYAVNAKEARN